MLNDLQHEVLHEIIDVLQSIGAICPNRKAELYAKLDTARGLADGSLNPDGTLEGLRAVLDQAAGDVPAGA